MKDHALDALDLRLVDALQSRPRASWASLARTLGSSDVTLARRWDALKESGAAWMTVAPDLSAGHGALAMGMALVEVRVRAGSLLTTAASLALQPEIATLEITSGARSLMLTVIAGDPDRLSTFLLETLDTHDAVEGFRSHPASWTHLDASRWRLLPRTGVGQGARDAVPHGPRPSLPRRDVAEAAARVLANDGRASAQQVARELGIGLRTARAVLAGLVASGELRFRTELSRPLSGWPVCAWYLVSSSASTRDQDVRALGTIPEVRAVVQTVGTFDLAVVTWMRSIAVTENIEATIEARLPSATVRDRAVVLRTVKIMGRVLDANARAVSHVPLPSYLNVP